MTPTTPCLRWRDRRGALRPADELIRTSEFEVAEILADGPARSFVERHHYSGSYPAARWRFGLYRAAQLVGVAVFSHPTNDKALTAFFPGEATASVELGRLVLLDEVPGNGESWFVARCFEQLRRKSLIGVLSFSDPFPRTTSTGRVVMPGHVGVVYQALNAVKKGRSKARTLALLPDGRVLSDRAIQKFRAGERGASTAYGLLRGFGAEAITSGETPAEWLAHWLPLMTRSVRHPGNHRYLWALDRAARRHLPKSEPYPRRAA